MATNYYNSFINKLKEIFMMDHAELDFGIYRIMNQKREDILHFLEYELLPQVNAVFKESGSEDLTAIKAQLKEMEKMAASFGVSPDANPEYQQLKQRLQNTADTAALQNDVFSHLVTFFSRYYDNGDFVSKRRYKDNTYAIPYNGEEVKLHWANADQYYIKTSEYFRDYTFVLPESRKKVHFILKDASTEQNNNKAANNMERRFAIYQPENETDTIMTVEDGELKIFFTYELMPKSVKQEELLTAAWTAIEGIIPAEFGELLSTKAPSSSNPNRTLLEKHLTDYTAKNSFDYFIHKDLGGFLSRELDFYIKNEVMHLDDLDVNHIQSQLSIVKAIKLVGDKIIRMLAQLENFQKRLWLKKKFVVQSDYCITLDRVPEDLYEEILANDKQREEWVRLFAIDEIKGDLTTKGYTVPLTEEFLQQNPFLVLDTAFFSISFKHKLLSEMENIDEQCDGILINSENSHALQLLQNRYKNELSGIYIDPPYNTGSDGFVYKDNYLHSSWLSMMKERLLLAKGMMKEDSPISVSINENELFNLKQLMDDIFCENYYTTFAVKVRHEDRILKGDKDFHEVYENLLFYSNSNKFKPLKREKDNTSIDDYNFIIKTNHPDFSLELGGKTVEVFSPNNYKIIKSETPSVNYLKRISVRGTIREGNSSGRFYVANIETLTDAYPNYLLKVPDIGDDGLGYRYFWVPSIESKRKNGDYFQGKPVNSKDIIQIPYPNLIDFEKQFNDATNEGGTAYRNGKKPLDFMNHVLELQKIGLNKRAIVLDFFAGSSSTAHAIIEMNKRDSGERKYLLMQTGNIFDSITKPRMIKAAYSQKWKDEKPIDRSGISQCFKYMRLEQYEDTLNNLQLQQNKSLEFDEGSTFKESYMLGYMLDTETRDSLLNLSMFENPFAMTLKTTKDNELVETPVDMVETFNYLIGLHVETEDWYKNDNICVVQGTTHQGGLHTLVIWRNCKEIDNELLNKFFSRMDFRTRDSEFDLIYVNGDNTLPNLKRDEDNWKVVLIEEEFTKRMFEND